MTVDNQAGIYAVKELQLNGTENAGPHFCTDVIGAHDVEASTGPGGGTPDVNAVVRSGAPDPTLIVVGLFVASFPATRRAPEHGPSCWRAR